MRSDWQVKKLSDIAEINPHESIKKGEMAKKIPMDMLHPFYKYPVGYVIEPFCGGAKFKNGDTIMARITPCLENGKIAQVNFLDENEVGFGSTEYIVYRAVEGQCDKDFLYYLITSPLVREPAIKSMVGSSGRQRVQTDVIKNLEIALPNINEQRKIGKVLRSIDDKIAINNSINQNLQQQAQAIFDFFYASATDQCLFTEKIQVLGGGTPKTSVSEYWNGEIPFFSPKDVGNPYTFQTEKNITEDGLAHCNSKLYPLNTCFVTARGTVGKVCLAGKPMAMNQSCYALMSETMDPLLVYFYTLKVISSLKHKASGAVFDAIITRDFKTEHISIINEDNSAQLLRLIKPLMDDIYTNSIESISLAELRDTLLPNLMSGELGISSLGI